MSAEAPAPAPAPARTVEQAQPAPAQKESRGPVFLRRCACGGVPGGDGECAACKARRLQRKARAEAAGAGLAPPIVHDVLRSTGKPLDAPVRGDMERRLGHDFSQVRVHADGRAAASAQAVEAQAYTVGRSVVFDAGRYAPGTSDGRDLLAHELAHVVQQGSVAPPSGPLRVGAANDPAESAADRAAAGQGTAGSTTSTLQLQRKVVVSPVAAAPQIETHLGNICALPLTHTATGELSSISCPAAPPNSCECVCDVIADASRTYTINVIKATVSTPNQTLWDGTTVPVPKTSMGPNTSGTTNPTIEFPDTTSDAEFGSFQTNGTAVWAPMWRILAHELCGHGRLNQSYTGGPGTRPLHDATIDTENTIAAEHGGPARGHYTDPKPPGKQGESYFNPVGDRSKVIYSQTNGLHFEAP